ncbi:MAG TPA: PQQ-binding-like beta-propeller repeat protein [Thermomicrobiales bacterium]|nr:PQQ-binding-like beta-propeller repeat protein [Thermomicrobiales bacterium]
MNARIRRPGWRLACLLALVLALTACSGGTATPKATSISTLAASATASPTNDASSAPPTATTTPAPTTSAPATAPGASAVPASPTATRASATPTQAATPAVPPVSDWVRFGFDPARSGVNPVETRISPQMVAGLRQQWRVTLPGVADSSPILLHDLAFPDGTMRDVLYVTTRDGRLLAVDAANGAVLWSKQPSGPKITHSSPVADPARKLVYAYGLDGLLHRYDAVTGDERMGNGWPVQITLMRDTEKESASLNIAGDTIYVTTSGYLGDAPPYQGHVVIVDAPTGQTHVFNSLCANLPRLLKQGDCQSQRSGIWARAGVVLDPATGNLFVATGNGRFNADSGGNDFGDSVIQLSPDGTKVIDSYTPQDYQELDDRDADLGSTAPALLPRIANSKTPLLLVQGGKDGLLRLVNRQNMSGQGGPGHVGGELQAIKATGCGTFTQPVVWTDPGGALWVIVAGQCALDAYQIVTDAGGTTRLQPAWTVQQRFTTPVLAGGVLFASGNGAVLALDPRTGKQLWSSANPGAGGTIGGIHWESPIVINGTLYATDEQGTLVAYR